MNGRSCDFFHELGNIPNDKTLAEAVNAHQVPQTLDDGYAPDDDGCVSWRIRCRNR